MVQQTWLVPADVGSLQALDAGMAGVLEDLRIECGQPHGAQPRLSVEYNGRPRRVAAIALQRLLAEHADLISLGDHSGFVYQGQAVVVEYEFPPAEASGAARCGMAGDC